MVERFKLVALLFGVSLVTPLVGCQAEVGDDNASQGEPSGESELGVTGTFQQGVTPSTGYGGVNDTTLREAAPTTNYGTSASVSSDCDDPAASRKRTNALLRFDLSSIPKGSHITSVKLTVNVTNRTSGSGYSLYPLSRSWSETQATWNSASTGASWSSTGARGSGDHASAPIGNLAPTSTGSFTVTLNAAGVAAAQAWVDTPSTNFGFVIDSGTNADGLGFDSSNAATAANRPRLSVAFDSTPTPVVSPYPVYTTAEVNAWSTSSPEYTRLANSWAGNVNRAYAAYGTQVSSTERDVLRDESVYIKVQAVLWATDGNAARRNKVVALLNDMRAIQSWQTDTVEQYRLVAGWATTNLAQAAALIGYRDTEFTRFLVKVNYPIMDWTGANNWQASFADSKLAVAVYVGDAALYADAKAYFYDRLAKAIYHSSYDGDHVRPVFGSTGVPSPSLTVQTWGGYWGAPQVHTDYTFVNPSYVKSGFNSETIRDLAHVSLGLGAWVHGARTILAHGDPLKQEAYDRIHAGYVVHAARVLAYKKTGVTPAPATVRGDGGTGLNLAWFGAERLFGSDTPADVVTLCKNPDVTGSGAAGALDLVAEAFADGT